jgi:hypothetical protein
MHLAAYTLRDFANAESVKNRRRLYTDCARMHRSQEIRVTFERKAGSPIYWKR